MRWRSGDLQDSLKADTRKKRSKGILRRVEPSSSIPGNWQAFLCLDENKVELFAYLATMIGTTETEKQIISTHHKGVLCTQPQDVACLVPSTHEEAEDVVRQGCTKILIHTVDTDVVILAVIAAEYFHIDEFWIAFTTGKNFRYFGSTWHLFGPSATAISWAAKVPGVAILPCLDWLRQCVQLWWQGQENYIESL
jgi:hypothetical protein